MRSSIKVFTVLICVLLHSFVGAQFNTITRSSDKVDLRFKISEEVMSKHNKKLPKTKIGIFSSQKKNDLRKEIDSLKVLLSKSKRLEPAIEKLNFNKIEDSLIKTLKEKVNQLISSDLVRTPVIKPELIGSPLYDVINSVHMAMPLGNKLRITSGFGKRIHPLSGKIKIHKGVDLKAAYENVYSVMDGYVTSSGWDSKGGGNFLRIRHSDTFVTSYLHLSKIYYRPGEFVKAGYIIGKSGSSGNSTGPHLHFSVTENGKHINPIHFLNDLIKANNLISNHNIL